MRYRNSNTDNSNFRWMHNDNSVATLMAIKMSEGSLRGISDFLLSFKYPITALAGRNTTGKSTVLAMAACAYHNLKTGYLPAGRSKPYYTFSDFFVQYRDEESPSGIVIKYGILYNKWRNQDPGIAFQRRIKRTGGRWNNYNRRVRRNVIYFGIQRVVPHYERTTHKSYRSSFVDQKLDETHRNSICSIASRIIGRTYSKFERHSHSKYVLPIAESGDIRYSGFNMGAGETAVFEILVSLFEAGKGTLLIIDELEIGLHEEAQVRLIRELKELCNDLHCQIICSTHSHAILSSLPPEGRFFLERVGTGTIVESEISADYACGKLRGLNTGELDIFVEDTVASSVLHSGIPHRLRQRVNIKVIGSSSAVMRALSTRYLENSDRCLCVLDGDKSSDNNVGLFARYTEGQFRSSEDEMRSWATDRLAYLPSSLTPEKWLLSACNDLEDKSHLARSWGVDEARHVDDWIGAALSEASHNELYHVCRESGVSEDQIVADLVRFVLVQRPDTLNCVTQVIDRHLSE